MATSEERKREREEAKRRKDAKARHARAQPQLFKPMDLQRNLITGVEPLDPARPRADLEAGTEGAPVDTSRKDKP